METSELTLSQLRQQIVFEDEALLVVNKPAGWPMHADRHHERVHTLLSLVLRHLGEVQPGPAFAHRLDKETSGLVLLAKTPQALRHVNRQLKLKQVQKAYEALLLDSIHARGSIRLALQKRMDRQRWLAVMVPVRQGGMYARTDYERLETLKCGGQALSLVLAHPLTGRTHQLRAHFAGIGHPIVGDNVYGNAGTNDQLRKTFNLRDGRQLLHAARLALVHPGSGRTVAWEAPLPADFAAVLQQLRQGM